jgi:succinate dehydrogenase / fumarate reductase cytochrome b subunit
MTNTPRVTTAERPLSPHLTFYKPQITSVLSITHRLTGVGLFLGALVLAWGIVSGIYSCNCILPLFGTTLGKLVLAGWTFALFYHLCNGIRHLFWDMGKGFKLCAVTTSGAMVVLGASVLTLVSWLIGLGIIGG